ncbi:MAG: FKBP-type peptidyl-prolyl cis-trans isomerase [Bacteroidales bacterium]|nr:FKBP-type peptidyl-prolyl cis-trans isomerase [Bacteroidales bacterium]MBO7379408.1 FKBP-type peptidyl-prolyl cis-trans isomerase [Bacteroidales bacterium]
MDQISYALGINIGQQLKQMGLKDKLSVADFAASINDVLQGNPLQVTPAKAQELLSRFFAELEAEQQKAAEEAGKVARQAGEKFLAENAKKAGVTVTASGLQYEVITPGTGRKPKATDTVRCHYEGTLIDGTVFDSSYARNEPAAFGLNQVIAGWTEGLQLMNEGAKFRFYIPFNLGYGAQGAGGSIPPYAALIFDVELLEVL